MLEDLYGEHSGEVLRGVLDESDQLLLVNPSRETVHALTNALQERPQPPPARVLADRRPLGEVTENFLAASTLAELVAGGTLEVRLLEGVPRHSLVVTRESVVSLVEYESRVAGVTTADTSFVRSTRAVYDDCWEHAEEFDIQAPRLSELRQTLREVVSEQAVEDFDSLVRAARETDGEVDAVVAALLVAANNDELLYDLTEWGERVGLASRATFSRIKTVLESRGVLCTEKVPIEVGRPRQRLQFDDPELREATVEELLGRVQTEVE